MIYSPVYRYRESYYCNNQSHWQSLYTRCYIIIRDFIILVLLKVQCNCSNQTTNNHWCSRWLCETWSPTFRCTFDLTYFIPLAANTLLCSTVIIVYISTVIIRFATFLCAAGLRSTWGTTLEHRWGWGIGLWRLGFGFRFGFACLLRGSLLTSWPFLFGGSLLTSWPSLFGGSLLTSWPSFPWLWVSLCSSPLWRVANISSLTATSCSWWSYHAEKQQDWNDKKGVWAKHVFDEFYSVGAKLYKLWAEDTANKLMKSFGFSLFGDWQ
jgi:hypothetical protein